MANIAERLAKIEGSIGGPFAEGDESLAVQNMRLNEKLIGLDAAFKSFVTDINGRLSKMADAVMTLTGEVQKRFDGLQTKVEHLEGDVALLREDAVLLKKAVVSDAASTSRKAKVPEPKAFQGSRNAKELENFLWDMEQYFAAAHIPEGEQVSITSMYLDGDAKLWWRTRVQEDVSMGKPRIDAWETMKKELKSQFLPCNAGWQARESLKKLRHTGTPREYVKAFSSLMLDISNMSDEDKLFNFVSGLQPWAQAELRRQNVKDVQGAMAAADSLADYNYNVSASSTTKGLNIGKKAAEDTSRKVKWVDGQNRNGNNGESSIQSRNRVKTGIRCFLCSGPHYRRDCPNEEKLAALLVDDSEKGDGAAVFLAPLQVQKE